MDLSSFKALTFDCYGTLIDWERGIWESISPILASHGLDRSREDVLADFAALEHEAEIDRPGDLYPDILAAVYSDLAGQYGMPVVPDEAAAFAGSVGDWPVFDDTAAALVYLKTHFKLVIISNVDRASFALSNKKLGVDFDAVITAQDVGAYKPSEKNFEFALARLEAMGVARSDVLHVAQSLFHDILPAKGLGLATIWVDRRDGRPGGATPSARPDCRVTSLGEVSDMHRAALTRA